MIKTVTVGRTCKLPVLRHRKALSTLAKDLGSVFDVYG